MMQLQDFHYDLPEELIARYPLAQRSASRLLCVNKSSGELSHDIFERLIYWLRPGDLLICNNTRVIPARLFGQKETGGQIEVMVERILDQHHLLAQIRASKRPRIGSTLFFDKGVCFDVVEDCDLFFKLRCHENKPVLDIIESIGHLPLPPYFHRPAEQSDEERYQTVFAEHKGSVAAPTAGLHFDEALLSQLKQHGIDVRYLVLHVGAGTFTPVRVEDITQHRMHAEYIEVSPELCDHIRATHSKGGRVIAVGTTVVRALESAALQGEFGEIHPFYGDTNIFIYPGFKFQCVDGLITNFHLPSSTLLMLVAAFGGYDSIMHAYRIAVAEKYRFFSYGDAMLVV